MQRTRCYYFYEPAFAQCNKRNPGSGCGAIEGYNRIHAILGASSQCIATHPSDMCVALAALGAQIRVRSQRGERTIPFSEFHRLPGSQPEIDTNLRPDELIVSIDLPSSPYAQHSAYVKVRDRASYAFALQLRCCRAPNSTTASSAARPRPWRRSPQKPWRSEKAEALLAGQKPGKETWLAAANEILNGARGY